MWQNSEDHLTPLKKSNATKNVFGYLYEIMQNCKISIFCPTKFYGYADVAKDFSRTMSHSSLVILDCRVFVEFPNFK